MPGQGIQSAFAEDAPLAQYGTMSGYYDPIINEVRWDKVRDLSQDDFYRPFVQKDNKLT